MQFKKYSAKLMFENIWHILFKEVFILMPMMHKTIQYCRIMINQNFLIFIETVNMGHKHLQTIKYKQLYKCEFS